MRHYRVVFHNQWYRDRRLCVDFFLARSIDEARMDAHEFHGVWPESVEVVRHGLECEPYGTLHNRYQSIYDRLNHSRRIPLRREEVRKLITMQ